MLTLISGLRLSHGLSGPKSFESRTRLSPEGRHQSGAGADVVHGKTGSKVILNLPLWVSALRWDGLHSAGVSIHQRLQFLAGLEIGNAFGWNFHERARSWITPYARRPLACAEASKAPDFDPIPSAQSANHTVENRLDDHLRVFPRHFHSARDFF